MSMPKSEEFFLEQPIYNKNIILEHELTKFKDLVRRTFKLIAYCPTCKRELVFNANKELSSKPPTVGGVPEVINVTYSYLNKPATLIFECSNDNSHKMVFFILLLKNPNSDEYVFMKIGQFPSMADIEFARKEKYKSYQKVLGSQMQEFTKAIGLASHGVGNGSFVYLRRIFESLIEETHKKAKNEQGWDEDTYSRMRMEDKIKALANYLPSPLVNDYQLYGILSKGIHELTEQDCLDYFPVVKMGIELILDDILENLEKQEKLMRYEMEKQKILGLIQS